jgi:transposase-like protein
MSFHGKRRKWSAADKLRMVLAGIPPGVEVSDLCRRDGLNSNPAHTLHNKVQFC